MRRWVDLVRREGVVLWVGVPGTFVWVFTAFLWPRIFGLGFLDYPNNVLVLNPGTGLGVGILFFCYFWTFYRLIRWQERKHLPTMGSLTIVYLVLLIFYAYNPLTVIQVWVGLVTSLAVANLISERHKQISQKKDWQE